MEFKDRLLHVIESKMINGKKVTSYSIGKNTNVSRQSIDNYISGKQKPTIENATLIADYLGVSVAWLLNGEPEEINNGEPSYKVKYPVKPFIDIAYGSCGDQKGFGLSVKKKDCEGLSLPINTEYDFSIKASGDSMINRMRPERSIRSGDIVACRSWKSRNHVRWGEVYALATEDGVIIKKVEQSAKEDSIRCVSFNIEENYLPYEIPTNEIHDWALVVGVVSVVAWN